MCQQNPRQSPKIAPRIVEHPAPVETWLAEFGGPTVDVAELEILEGALGLGTAESRERAA
jgi:hypothetical protein